MPFRYGTSSYRKVGDPLRVVEAYLAGQRAPSERRLLEAKAGSAEAEAEKAQLLMTIIRAAMGGQGPGGAPGVAPRPAQPIPEIDPGVSLPEAGPMAPTPSPAPGPATRQGGGMSPLIMALLGIPRVSAEEQYLGGLPPERQAEMFETKAGVRPRAGEALRAGIDITQHGERMRAERQRHVETLAQRGQEFALKQREFDAAVADRDTKRADALYNDMGRLQKDFAEGGPAYAPFYEPMMERNRRILQAITGQAPGAKAVRPTAPKREIDEKTQAEVRKKYLEDAIFRQFVDILTEKGVDDKTARTALEYIVPRMKEAGVDASIEEPGRIRAILATVLPFLGAPPRLKIEQPGEKAPTRGSTLKGQRTNRPDGTYQNPKTGETYTVKGGMIQ